MKSGNNKLTFTGNSLISAIYFGLLQCGYNFFHYERDIEQIEKINDFIYDYGNENLFFSNVRQNTCKVYPYWPRASILETATLYIDVSQACYTDFQEFKNTVMSADNISDIERTQSLWNWIVDFPKVLKRISENGWFKRYLEWERSWINEQSILHDNELQYINHLFRMYADKYKSPICDTQIIINPIKCVYSADYHLKNDKLIICSGNFNPNSIIHEYTHLLVNPIVKKHANEILDSKITLSGIDQSYFLNGSDAGRLNAFEEYMVCKLTDAIISNEPAENLDDFLFELLA